MSKPELINYKNALKDKAYPSTNVALITRISANENHKDQDLIYENLADPFEIDQTKILDSKSLRREAYKTQVFFDPENPHIRTRLTHTHEVVAVSALISQILGLNTGLAKSAALGHDLGHGPTGHLFETVCQELGIKFRHEVFSGISTVFIERNGQGLNLTKETIEGILKHSRGAGELVTSNNSIDEHNVVMYSDKIAYLFSDVNDLKRFGCLSSEHINRINNLFPGNQRDKVEKCILALVKESANQGRVAFENSTTAKKFNEVKSIMYQYYPNLNSHILGETLKKVFDKVDHIPSLQNYDPVLIIGMLTDKELKTLLDKIVCSKRIDLGDLKDFGVYEIIESGVLDGKNYQDLEVQLRQKLTNQ